MNVLIVERDSELGAIWAKHIERLGASVSLTQSEGDAVVALQDRPFDVVILNLVLDPGSAFAVADYASYRQPNARIVFVTNTTFFSDGSIFRHIPNACAFLPRCTDPEDLAAVVDHYGLAEHAAEPEFMDAEA